MDAASSSKPETSLLLNTLPKELPAEFLKEITDGFSPARQLGKGAFGTVYRVRVIYLQLQCFQ